MTADEVDGLVLTVSDFIPPHCAWGLRHWWKQHGLDFADFLKNGIDAKILLATGDLQVLRIIAKKRGLTLE